MTLGATGSLMLVPLVPIRYWNKPMPSPPARRLHPRALCSELVQISFRDQRGRRMLETGVLEDLGERGARLSLSLPLTPGNQVGFRAAGFDAVAQVSYCELSDTGYAVGLEFASNSKWDEQSWSPEHMLKIPDRETQE